MKRGLKADGADDDATQPDIHLLDEKRIESEFFIWNKRTYTFYHSMKRGLKVKLA